MRAAFGVLLFAAAACRPTPNESAPPVASASSTAAPACPACECDCRCSGGADREVAALTDAAIRKFNHRDGAGCLADLDRLAQIDPAAAKRLDHSRAMCMMLAGQCKAGKRLAREALADTMDANYGPELRERTVETYAVMYCEGELSEREQLLKAWRALSMAATAERKSAAFCEEQHRIVDRLHKTVRPRDADDYEVIGIEKSIDYMVVGCYTRAGECRRAYALHKNDPRWDSLTSLGEAKRNEILRESFDSMFPRCKGK